MKWARPPFTAWCSQFQKMKFNHSLSHCQSPYNIQIEAQQNLPVALYEFFSDRMELFHRDSVLEFAAQEVKAIRYIIDSHGDVAAARLSYQQSSRHNSPDEGLNPLFLLYMETASTVGNLSPGTRAFHDAAARNS